ncbi:MAG: PIN domain-containing protein [Deltaproteobacteria bacterium]|nr:MAG: PIN domain-containing protein [Deltaproteobacteria bacterium]
MKELVIDASVILKWYLPDEEFASKALNILHRHVSGEIVLCAPTILPYEILNAFLMAERRGRVNEEVTRNAFNAFLDLEINFLDPFMDYPGIISPARSFDRSVYDASYLAVAEKRNFNFVTGDKRLYNAVRKKLKWVQWIGQMND